MNLLNQCDGWAFATTSLKWSPEGRFICRWPIPLAQLLYARSGKTAQKMSGEGLPCKYPDDAAFLSPENNVSVCVLQWHSDFMSGGVYGLIGS